MFDSVVVIDPIIYGDSLFAARYKGTLPGLQRVLKTKFASEEEFKSYFQNESMFNRFDPVVLDQFMKSELNIHPSRKGPNEYVQLKSSKEFQMIVYSSGPAAVPIGMSVLPFIKQKLLHLVGLKQSWNPPESNDFFNSTIPDITTVEIDNATHLINCEIPDVVIREIEVFINNRAFSSFAEQKSRRNEIFLKHYSAVSQSIAKSNL